MELGTTPVPHRGHRPRPSAHRVAPAALDRFATGTATPTERREIVRHLLAGCPDCQRRLQEHWLPALSPQAGYGLAFDRVTARLEKGEPPFAGWALW